MPSFVKRVVNRDIAKEDIRRCIAAYDGKLIEIIIRPFRKKRSNAQNRHYWAVVIPAVDAYLRKQGTVADAEEIHDFLMKRVGKYTKVLQIGDDGVHVRKSSTKLTTADWVEYIEILTAWGAEHGIDIAMPRTSSWAKEK